MTHRELFDMLDPILAPHLETELQRRDLCIASTRVAIYVGDHFGVQVEPQACRVLAVNRQFARHLNDAHARGVHWSNISVKTFADLDGSHSVGIGFRRDCPWPYHLVATGGGLLADFSVWQAERPEQGIRTGTAIIAPLAGNRITCVEETSGTEVHYWLMDHEGFKRAPDWKHERIARLAGPLIRKIRAMPGGGA